MIAAAQVILKKRFNDDTNRGFGVPRANAGRVLSGELWYTQQAYRALNQVIHMPLDIQ